MGALPYRSMHLQVAHDIILEIIPRLLSDNVVDFAKASTEFPLSCVADGFQLLEETLWFWAGAAAIQHPLVRIHSISRTQDETALLAAKETFPFLLIHGEE